MSPAPSDLWAFCAGPDEDLRSWSHPGGRHFWRGARSAGKQAGEPVLFLQSAPRPPRWLGLGTVLEQEERWRVLGVWVECREMLRRPLPCLPLDREGRAAGGVAEILRTGASAWENRALATTIGLTGFQPHTPYLEDTQDLRICGGDWERILVLQPGLGQLMARRTRTR